jgi:4-hydroxy-3-polyprenylbenzoate decarboxylase/2,5-furandicarboxylate decarboxylase 1
MPFRDLREFIAHLEDQKELRRIRKPVDTKYEIAAYIRKTSDIKGPALLFENVNESKVPVLGGVFATRKRALLALETSEKQYGEKFHQALEHLVPPRKISSGPCKEVVLKSEDADLSRFPIPIFSQNDSGPFITAGLVISKDPESARNNTSIYRLQVHGPRRLGIKAQQLARQLRKAETKGEALPVAIAIGTDPVLMLASQWDAPYGVDELELAGALRGEPVEVVRAETVDLLVPATAEVVIEGYIQPRMREVEGPFGEVGGYSTPKFPKPVIEVTAITHRKNPIFQAALTGMPTTENHILRQIPMEATYYWELKKRHPGVTAVHFPAAGAILFLVIIAVKQTYLYEARNAIASMFATRRNKIIIVVDDDVDIYDMEKVMWAVATRSRPEEDVVVFPRLSTSGMDPSAFRLEGTDSFWNSGLGIDATKPYGQPFPDVVEIPGVDKVNLDEET